MMTSDAKSVVPALLDYNRSDLFTFENLSKNVKLIIPSKKSIVNANGEIIQTDSVNVSWESVISLLPLEFYRIIESYPNMYTTEKFDKKYIRNPKKCAYDRYESTNMWRPLMILNRCPTIAHFDFEYIRYYNITTFSKILSVLISRSQNG